MALGLWVYVAWAVFVGIVGVALLIWAWRSGQFKNVEEAKYSMLEDREPEPWPDKTNAGKTKEAKQDGEKGEDQP
jgi:cbb3-type cytochrome oxidase maturation protein